MKTETIKAVAEKIGLTFKTVAKVAQSKDGRWKNCEARGVKVAEELEKFEYDQR